MDYQLRLYKDELAPQAMARALPAAAAVRAIYVVSGGLRLAAGGAIATLGANSAWHSAIAPAMTGSHLASVALRWELAAADAPGSPLAGDGVSSAQLLSAEMTLDKQEPWLLRCDRVDFPPGGEAFKHTHRGGGIRCLLSGSIEIETRGARHGYRPLEAWFEAGPDPVYAAASAAGPTAFVRVMVLPRALAGKSSISYVNPEDLARPRSQRYQVFIDAPVELP